MTTFSRLLFLHAHREASALDNEILEESGEIRYLRAACLANIKGSVGLISTKTSAMRIFSCTVTFFILGFRIFCTDAN